MNRIAWICLLLGPSLSGCTYLANRANDLLDVFWLDAGVGLGLHADVRVTDWFAVGGLVARSTGYGLHGRYFGPVEWIGGGVPPGMCVTMFVGDGSGRSPQMAPLLPGEPSTYHRGIEPMPCNYMMFFPGLLFGSTSAPDDWENLPSPWMHSESAYFGARKLRVADLAVGASCGLALRVGVSPGELVDLLLGVVGIDVAGDDRMGEPPVPQPATTEAPDQPKNP